MSVRIIIRVNAADEKRLRAAFERLSKMGRSLRRPLGRIGLFIRREAAQTLRLRKHEWGPTTGRLSKSLAMRVDEMSVTVGSNLVYAAIQQLGGEARPKGHKYLALPVATYLRRRGVWPRDLPRDSMKYVKAAVIKIGGHSWIGPALVRAKDAEQETSADGAGLSQEAGGNPLTSNVKGPPRRHARPVRQAGEVMFALVKRVRIRGRKYLEFSPAARAFALAELEREYRRAIVA